jgi:cell division protein FtsL
MALLSRTIARTQSKAQASLRTGPILLAAVAIIVIVALLRVVQTSQATTASFQIQDLEEQKLELETSVQELEAEIASLSSLARIEQEAERLGLGPPAARDGFEVNVAPPIAEGERLPSRFQPDEKARTDEGGSPWWQDLLGLLPFD